MSAPVPRPGPRRDPSLPHQVVLHHTGSDLYMSCNCLARKNDPGNPSYPWIGQPVDYEQTRTLYNDPANHDRPFSSGDELADWREKAKRR